MLGNSSRIPRKVFNNVGIQLRPSSVGSRACRNRHGALFPRPSPLIPVAGGLQPSGISSSIEILPKKERGKKFLSSQARFSGIASVRRLRVSAHAPIVGSERWLREWDFTFPFSYPNTAAPPRSSLHLLRVLFPDVSRGPDLGWFDGEGRHGMMG